MPFNTTVKHALRWLTGTSVIADIDGGFQAIAEDVDGKLTPFDQGALANRPASSAQQPSGKAGRLYRVTDRAGRLDQDHGTGWTSYLPEPPVLTALPATPVDGQTILFQADLELGVLWALRYRAASASPFKWEVLGGQALTAEVAAREGDAGSPPAWFDLATPGPALTLPLAGEYDLEFGAHAESSQAGIGLWQGLRIGTTDPTDLDAAIVVTAGGPDWALISHRRLARRTITAPGTAVRCRYRGADGTPDRWSRRYLTARPLRVG